MKWQALMNRFETLQLPGTLMKKFAVLPNTTVIHYTGNNEIQNNGKDIHLTIAAIDGQPQMT